MRILIHGINFSPEITGIGKYTGKLAAYLCESGHELHMVTAPPYYLDWPVQPGYKGWQCKWEELVGVEIFRAPIWVPCKPSGIRRIIQLISFVILSFPLLLGQVG